MLRKTAGKLLLIINYLSHYLAQTTIIVFGESMTFMALYDVLKVLFKQNKYTYIISAVLSILSAPAWFDIANKIDNDDESNWLSDVGEDLLHY